MENNDDTPEADLTRDITRATSKYEREKDAQRTKMGMKRKANEGHFPGKAPIGYLNLKDENDKGYIVVNEITAPFCEESFKYYASGDMYSLESLGRKMFLEGLRISLETHIELENLKKY